MRAAKIAGSGDGRRAMDPSAGRHRAYGGVVAVKAAPLGGRAQAEP